MAVKNDFWNIWQIVFELEARFYMFERNAVVVVLQQKDVFKYEQLRERLLFLRLEKSSF